MQLAFGVADGKNFHFPTGSGRIDPNPLYFGFWIVPGCWVNSHNWEMMADDCDVIGFDLVQKIRAADLAVLQSLDSASNHQNLNCFCGAFRLL